MKETAMFERSLMNMNFIYSDQTPSESKQYIESLMNIDTGYAMSRTKERPRYEENVHDKVEYQDEMKRMMIAVKNQESFEINIDDKGVKQQAFIQVLQHILKMKTNEWRQIIYGYNMKDIGRMINLNRESDIETMIRCILDEMTVEE